MQSLPESVQGMVGSMYLMLEKGGDGKDNSDDLQQMQQRRKAKSQLSY
jgi:hypothetical protein